VFQSSQLFTRREEDPSEDRLSREDIKFSKWRKISTTTNDCLLPKLATAGEKEKAPKEGKRSRQEPRARKATCPRRKKSKLTTAEQSSRAIS